MIVGIGVDILEVERMEKNINSLTFMNRIYSKNEQDFFIKRKNNLQTVAGFFVAKEAISKAFGTGVRGFELFEVEIEEDNLGKPKVKLYGKAKKIAIGKGIDIIHISISHEKNYAIAYAIAERLN